MYTLPSRLKITFIVLMMIGAAGLGVGFLSAPSTVAEAQAMVADAHYGGKNRMENRMARLERLHTIHMQKQRMLSRPILAMKLHRLTKLGVMAKQLLMRIITENICYINCKINLGPPFM